MNEVRPNVSALMHYWLGKISPPLFVILSVIYLKASGSTVGVACSTIQDLAAKTGLSWRTVQGKLHELAGLGAIQILSVARQRMKVQIPEQYRAIQMDSSREGGVPTPTVAPPMKTAPKSTAELIFALCGEQASSEMLGFMQTAAGGDELRLQCCLDDFLKQGKRWETLSFWPSQRGMTTNPTNTLTIIGSAVNGTCGRVEVGNSQTPCLRVGRIETLLAFSWLVLGKLQILSCSEGFDRHGHRRAPAAVSSNSCRLCASFGHPI